MAMRLGAGIARPLRDVSQRGVTAASHASAAASPLAKACTSTPTDPHHLYDCFAMQSAATPAAGHGVVGAPLPCAHAASAGAGAADLGRARLSAGPLLSASGQC
jgi:hypothetical protein